MADQQENFLISIDYSELAAYEQAAADASETVERLREELKALQKSGSASNAEIEAAKAELANARKEYSKNAAELQKMQKANKASGMSYNDLAAQVAAADAKLKSMPNAFVKAADGSIQMSEEAKAAAEELKKLRDALAAANTEAGDERSNVGRYKDGVMSAFAEMTGGVGEFAGSFKFIGSAVQKAGVSIQSLKGVLMASGIGAFVLLIGSLISYFKESSAGAKLFSQAGAAIGAIFDTLLNILKPVGEWIVKVFSDPKQAMIELKDFLVGQIITRFNGLKKILGGIIDILKGDFSKGMDELTTGASEAATGVTDLKGKVAKLEKQMREAAEAAADLAAAQYDLQVANVQAGFALSDLQKRAENYKQVADDATRSLKDRASAASAAESVERQMRGVELQLAKRAYDLAVRQFEMDKKNKKDGIENQQKLLDAYKTLKEAETSYNTSVNENAKRRREIALDTMELSLDSIEKGFEAVKATNLQIIGDDKKTVEERRLVLEALKKTRDDAAAKEIDYLQKNSKKQIDLADLVATKDSVNLDKKLKGLNLSEKATIRLQDVVKNYIDTETEFADQKKTLDEKALARKVAFTAKEKELIDDIHNKQRLAVQEAQLFEIESSAKSQSLIAERTIKNTEERALKIMEIEMAQSKATRDAELENLAQNQAIEEAQRYEKAQADIKNMQLETSQRNALLLDAEKQHQQNLADIAAGYARQKADNQIATEQEITAHQQKQTEMRKAALESTLNVAAGVFGTMSELAGKQTKVGKALAITQALINTYASANAAYNSAAQIPFVGYILGPIAAAAAVVSGLKSVQAIKSSDSGGGSTASAGGGSLVSASFTAVTSQITSAQAAAATGGGASSASTDTAAAKAGEATANALKDSPPVVYVDTFEAKQKEKAAIVKGATY